MKHLRRPQLLLFVRTGFYESLSFYLLQLNFSFLCLKQEVTGGKGPNVILDMLADVNLQKDLEMIADKGQINVRSS